MRGWWSTRPKAKIWDGGGAARAFERRDDAPTSTPPAPAQTPPAATPPTPTFSGTTAVTPPPPIAVPPAVAPAATSPAPPAAPASAPTVSSPITSGPPPLAALFPPRPDDFLTRETLVEEPPAAPAAAPVADSPYYERTALAPADPAPPAPGTDTQGEFLRLLEVVTSMCDHVIEYIEADRAERRLMMETLTQLGRVITEGSAAAVAAFSALTNANAVHQLDAPSEPSEPAPSEPWAFTRAARAAEQAEADAQARERVIGGSMPAGPAPRVEITPEPEPEPESEPEPVAFIDLVAAESSPSIEEQATLPSAKIHIAVEVRGRFGDRWVDGFEICEVMTTPAGPRYRLRRRRDGVVLPELFDASNIRHVETPETASTGPAAGATNGASGAWSAGEPQSSRERSMDSHPSGSGGDSAPVNGSGYWSRS